MPRGDSNNGRELPLAEVARLLRRSRGYLAAAIQEGLPARSERGPRGTTEWRLDVGRTAKWLEQRAVVAERERLKQRHAAEVARLRAALEGATGDDDEVSWQEARRRRMLAEARIREADAEERAGRSAPIDVMRDYSVDIFTGVRTRILAVPSKVSPMVAVESEPRRCFKILDDEIRQTLEAIADAKVEDLIERTVDVGKREARRR